MGANPIPIQHPTNLALFGHKITLYRFNQGNRAIGLILLQGAQIGAGAEPPWPPHFNHWARVRVRLVLRLGLRLGLELVLVAPFQKHFVGVAPVPE